MVNWGDCVSFSSNVKEELSKLPVSGYEIVLAELSGLVPMCGILSYNNGKIFLEFNTENPSLTRRVFTFLRRYFDFNCEVRNVKSKQLKKNLYTISLDENSSKVLLDEIKFLKGENVFTRNYKPLNLTQDVLGRKAYIRGSFLGAGIVVDPKKSYHLEFVCNNLEHAQFLRDNINYFNLGAKIVTRKDNLIIYLKDAQSISDILSLMGAHNSLLDFENTRVIKDMRNNVNRIVNCESYNINKIVKTSYNQVQNILYIKEHLGLDKISDDLREICLIRLKHRDISLGEIGKMLKPPLSKSTINYRFKKINNIANKLRGDLND